MKPILSPRQLAEAIGVSESSIKRWVDDGHIGATRTAGGHRRISIEEAVRFVRERALVVPRPDLMGLPPQEEAGEGRDLRGAGERLFGFLRAGDAAEVRALLLSRYLAGASIAEIVDGPLSQAMERVGELWVSEPSGIFWEHRATQIAFDALNDLRSLLVAQPSAPVAVGGAPVGDNYMLPSLAVAAVLEGEGLRVSNLGAETPVTSLALAVEELAARVAWLSVSVAADPDGLRREITGWLPRLRASGAVLVVGGSKAAKLGLSRSDALYVGRSMGELEALVQGMRLADGTAAPV